MALKTPFSENALSRIIRVFMYRYGQRAENNTTMPTPAGSLQKMKEPDNYQDVGLCDTRITYYDALTLRMPR